jgi:hypothetical protein
MATFIDEGFEEPQDDEQFSPVDEGEEQQENFEQEPEEQTEEDDIPDKYKGKSIKDIVRMHQEAERAIGKQGSEVGELRRIVDDFVKAQTVTQQQAPVVEEEVDFFIDPDKAIARAIEKHPKVKQAEELSAQMKKAEALANLKSSHPDYTDIIQSESFGEWVNKSKVRRELLSRADREYDFDAADELLTTWKERNQVVEQTKQVEQVQRKQAVRSASTGSSKGSGETASKKTYRRADIIELMRTNPDRYEQLAPEIMQAYAEGRVK